ncbi:MAG TPA: 16S rRNA (cytosine(967)-C(5))-methyltransferase RsmB [Pseudomonadales bacterium]
MTRASASPAANERAHAARLLHAVVVERRTTDQVLAREPASPLTQELLLGCLRHFFSLEREVAGLLHRPMKPKDRDVWLLMLIGVYQLRFTRIPDHAAIFETVAACTTFGKPWAAKLVNAVLRRAASADAAAPGAEPPSEHPEWLERALRTAYPDADVLMQANNARAPMALRVNVARCAPADYRTRLDAAGIGWRAPHAGTGPGGFGPETLVLDAPRPMQTLPGYPEGHVAVQDAGAQLAVQLLEPRAGERVLDACAAPGGKLFHLIERYPGARVTALDRSEARLAQLGREAERLGHRSFTAIAADATELDWWDGEPYRWILLDAPCSGTGTLRRHPDIKLLRRPEDLPEFVERQQRLLDALWQVLEPGGTLVYCTCSILPAENDEVIARFRRHRRDVLACPLRLATGRATGEGWQLLPTDPDTDGFYFSRMSKAAR